MDTVAYRVMKKDIEDFENLMKSSTFNTLLDRNSHKFIILNLCNLCGINMDTIHCATTNEFLTLPYSESIHL